MKHSFPLAPGEILPAALRGLVLVSFYAQAEKIGVSVMPPPPPPRCASLVLAKASTCGARYQNLEKLQQSLKTARTPTETQQRQKALREAQDEAKGFAKELANHIFTCMQDFDMTVQRQIQMIRDSHLKNTNFLFEKSRGAIDEINVQIARSQEVSQEFANTQYNIADQKLDSADGEIVACGKAADNDIIPMTLEKFGQDIEKSCGSPKQGEDPAAEVKIIIRERAVACSGGAFNEFSMLKNFKDTECRRAEKESGSLRANHQSARENSKFQTGSWVDRAKACVDEVCRVTGKMAGKLNDHTSYHMNRGAKMTIKAVSENLGVKSAATETPFRQLTAEVPSETPNQAPSAASKARGASALDYVNSFK